MKNRISFHGSWAELREYGIQALTGESCAYSMRILCDLNQDGVDLLTNYLGGTIQFQEKSNWNSQVNGKPSVASVMLPYGFVLELQRYILFHVEQFQFVYVRQDDLDSSMIGSREQVHDGMRDHGYNLFINHAMRSSAPMQGGRNVHAFTGRTT